MKMIVMSYVDKVVYANGLVKDKDYEVISKFAVIDYELVPIDRLKETSFYKENDFMFSETPTPDTSSKFYLLNEGVDIALATECSLGVVKLLTGEHKGRLGVYFVFYGTDGIWDDFDEMIAMNMYLQLKHPEIYFEKLQTLFEEDSVQIQKLLIGDLTTQMEKFSGIFETHKLKRRQNIKNVYRISSLTITTYRD